MLKLKNILFPISVRYNSNTIYALSSGHGTCGVAVIRITGIVLWKYENLEFYMKSKNQKLENYEISMIGYPPALNSIKILREIKAKIAIGEKIVWISIFFLRKI